MNTSMNMPIDIYQLLNTLIQNKGINIKKLYSLNKNIIEEDNITIKNIYCKNRTNKGNLCLNRCIEYSKYCRVHDPIMKEQKKLNRIKMNIKRKILKQENTILRKIDYEIGNEYIPSAPLLEDIKEDPPIYEQKPDECGTTIINMINNKPIYNMNLNQTIIDNMAMEIENIKAHSLDYYKSVFINEGDILAADNIKPDNIISSRNQNLLKINMIKDNNNIIFPVIDKLLPFDNNNKPITSVDEYKNKINNIDFKFLNSQYKGLDLNKLYGNTIKFEMRLLYLSNDKKINSKIITYINKFIKSIPK